MSFTRTDELPLGQNGNGLKTDKNTNSTEIKRERNGNGTVLPVPLYGWQMEKKNFDAYHTSFYYRKYITLHKNIIFSLRKITTILAIKMKYLITTISPLNQLLVIANLPAVNPDELEVVESWEGETEVILNHATYSQIV